MAKARETRSAAEIKGCTADAEALAAFAAQQDAIKSVLPPTPNERLVYDCQNHAGD
jgi:hypothetical protein